MMKEVVIVGAGVIGLSTAFAICEKLPHTDITIVSELDPQTFQFLRQYTSAWAGAHFRPFPSKNAGEFKDFPLSRATQRRFRELSQTNPESSIRFVKGVEYFEEPDEFYRTLSPGYTEEISNFRVLNQKELPSGSVLGTEYDTFVLNAPHYLQFLYRKLQNVYGVKFLVKRLNSLHEAAKYCKTEAPTIINCTGMGLGWNGGYDAQCFAIRGQTVLIRAPEGSGAEKLTVTHQLKTNQWTFFIPRPLDGGIILGGTKQVGDGEGSVREEDTKEILRRGAELFPQLMHLDEKGKKYFSILSVNVGFRPARHGGMNISKEYHDGVVVINAYGAGGSGFEFSYGVGERVVELMRDLKL